ncbi:MAG: hypothetical protein LUM44_23685 [Pyrinomonadaceae bacterium]|nr:hypothetical protein [Pyrinomonadaceae bacterium]
MLRGYFQDETRNIFTFEADFIHFFGFSRVCGEFHPFFWIFILLVTISIRFSGFSSCWRRFPSVCGDFHFAGVGFHPFAASFDLSARIIFVFRDTFFQNLSLNCLKETDT